MLLNFASSRDAEAVIPNLPSLASSRDAQAVIPNVVRDLLFELVRSRRLAFPLIECCAGALERILRPVGERELGEYAPWTQVAGDYAGVLLRDLPVETASYT